MKVLHATDQPLSIKASELIQFDMDSIRQLIASRHGKVPEVWLADPEQYERGGRLLRDSTTPRLLAYAPESRTLYVTDGCNSCCHELFVDIKTLTAVQLREFAEKNGVRADLLERLSTAL